MSLTFSIEGLSEEHGYELPCKGCGVSLVEALEPGEKRHLDCRACGGYGGAAEQDMPKPRHELNVNNGRGAALLWALGLPVVPSGEVDPRDLLVALEGRGGHAAVAGYRRILERIATRAASYHRLVVWN